MYALDQLSDVVTTTTPPANGQAGRAAAEARAKEAAEARARAAADKEGAGGLLGIPWWMVGVIGVAVFLLTKR